MSGRDEFAQRVETFLGHALDHDQIKALWFDSRPGYGLRLSELGWRMAVEKLNMQHWCYNIEPEVLVPRNLLILDRQLSCPYFLQRRGRTINLMLFGSKEAVMANLYGDVNQWLISLAS